MNQYPKKTIVSPKPILAKDKISDYMMTLPSKNEKIGSSSKTQAHRYGKI